MGVKTEYKKAARIELEFSDYSIISCIVLAEMDADITSLARGWLYEYPAKKVTAYRGLTDEKLVCYVRDKNHNISIVE